MLRMTMPRMIAIMMALIGLLGQSHQVDADQLRTETGRRSASASARINRVKRPWTSVLNRVVKKKGAHTLARPGSWHMLRSLIRKR